jgi:hypothetical protein
MASMSTNEMIGCAAMLLAAVVLHLAPRWFRQAFFVIVFGSGLLAAAAGFGGSMADAAVARLFG